jgi:2-succinyl-5-enolpyruvyl-6-hydroxy-3-cyclohexene-1-carboxylate synthase
MIDPSNRNTALASALVDELGRAGVARAIVSPGSRSSPLALALDRSDAIAVDVVLDERCAGFVALAAALSSGAPVAVTCTSGSAAANLHPAVVEADLAGVPLIVLTSDRPPELRGIGAGQTIDQIKLYGDAVRWFSELGSHDADDAGLLHFRAAGARAVAEASGGRGPVHLNIPWRDPLGPEPVEGALTATDPLALAGRTAGRPLTSGITARAPHAELIDALAEALSRASRPLMIAGREPRAGVNTAVAALAVAAGIPVLAEPTSGLRIGPEAGDHSIAHYDLILRQPPADLDPDLVLRTGDMPTSKPLRAWLKRTGGPDQIVIGAPGRWNEPTHRAGAVIDVDPGLLLQALVGGLGESAPGDPAWLGAWQRADAAAAAAIEAGIAGAAALNEPALARAFAAAIGDREQGLLASSMPVRDVESFAAVARRDARLFSNRGANGIDGLVSTASGLSLGAGRRPTWALLGDLATAYDIGGLPMLANLGLPVKLVVADNGGGRIFEFLPQAEQVEADRFNRLFITPSGLDFEAVAKAFGLRYARIEDPAELAAAGAEHGGPILIHVPLDAEHNVALHREIAAAVATAVGSALRG